MKLGDLLNNIAGKAGKQNDKGIVDLLSKADLMNVEVQDDVANELVTQLMTADGAKNNADVKKHFFAQALNGIDSEINSLATELGVEFKSENTYDRIRLLSAKMKEAQTKQSGGDKEQYETQIKDLNNKMAKLIEDHDKSVLDLQGKHNDEITDFMIQSMLSGKSYAMKDLPIEANVTTAKTLLSQELAKKGVKLVRENGTLKLKQSGDTNLDYYDEAHKAVSFEDFTNSVLAANKLLAVSAPASAPGNTTPKTIIPGEQPNNAKGLTAVQNSLADLQPNN